MYDRCTRPGHEGEASAALVGVPWSLDYLFWILAGGWGPATIGPLIRSTGLAYPTIHTSPIKPGGCGDPIGIHTRHLGLKPSSDSTRTSCSPNTDYSDDQRTITRC